MKIRNLQSLPSLRYLQLVFCNVLHNICTCMSGPSLLIESYQLYINIYISLPCGRKQINFTRGHKFRASSCHFQAIHFDMNAILLALSFKKIGYTNLLELLNLCHLHITRL